VPPVVSHRRDPQASAHLIAALASAERAINVLIRLADEADEEPRMALAIFSVADELSKLVALKDRGVLSEIEFNTQRQKLLTGPSR
jgi:hypothetical protein